MHGGTHTWGRLLFLHTHTHSLIHSLANHTHIASHLFRGHTLARTPSFPPGDRLLKHLSLCMDKPFQSPWGPGKELQGERLSSLPVQLPSVSILGSLMLSPKLRKALSPSLLPECHSLHSL